MNKSPMTAFFLSFLPGVGHAYLGRPVRFLVYGGSFFGAIGMALFLGAINALEGEFFFLLFLVAAVSGIINMIDMIITLMSGNAPGLARGQQAAAYNGYNGGSESFSSTEQQSYTSSGGNGTFNPSSHSTSYEQQQEKSKTILLSLIPGLGHMNLGLMQRGITFLISFIGLFAIIVFLSAIMNSGAILVFLLALPIIWIYGIFDAVSLIHAKHRGELIEDRSLFEGVEAHIASGQKNKVLAISLAIFPGAGHLYLGLQKRGLQLMAGFLLAIYIMDTLRLSLFLFILPLFWCFAFFDALGSVTRYERQKLSDEPVLPMFVPYQRWLGVAMLLFGIYFIVDRIVLRIMSRVFPDIYSYYLTYKYMFPIAIIAFVMIVLGMRLAFGNKSIIGSGSYEQSRTTVVQEQRSDKR
ncbi:hypothetical protein I6N90_18705 [Paenibacillus sp. GSMTC-2017]|uniref:hypothetical protein n=1 Tax=Paenibacillus sp. GSMTC-2017 TaxID=2794350 RepID=UPI0018D8C86B|nr:hypothetical protein [Paenibacillus sp. GSMTC-2017]MBH5319834.1 hypothetical protein [Paenibacillus sp. GSMTC-2017]